MSVAGNPLAIAAAHAVIDVMDRGPGIPDAIAAQLFRPFYTTSEHGTGLGLYICRELCERHGASIDYRQHPASVRHRNEFFMTLPVAPLETNTSRAS